MSLSPRLSLPFILPQQAQKHVTVNEAVRRLDALVQLSVASRTVTAQPGTPAEGASYVLPSGKTGAAWGSMATGAIAAFQDGAWTEIAPKEGFGAWVEDTNTIVFYDGAAWSGLSAVLGLGAAANQIYETGVFTPVLTASDSNPTVSYVTQAGVYTRIGRYVFAEIGIATSSASGGAGTLRISLPFVAAATNTHGGNVVAYSANWATNQNPTRCLSIPGASYCQLYPPASSDARAGIGGALTAASLTAGGYNNLVWTNVIYKV